MRCRSLNACSKTDTASGNNNCSTTAGANSTNNQVVTVGTGGPTVTSDVKLTQYNAAMSTGAENGIRTDISNTTISNLGLAALSRDFTFDNAGLLDGNLTVKTGTTTGATINNANSHVIIKEHVFGGGSLDKFNPNDESGFIGGAALTAGTLRVYDEDTVTLVQKSSLARTTTIVPVLDGLVMDGEWYRVAKKLDDSGNIGDLPNVADTIMVDWTAEKLASGSQAGALVIGAEVHDASIIEGLSSPGISTINALLQGGNDEVNELAVALQSSDDADELRVAGEQLAPETNFATQQAAWTLNFLTGSYIDNRLAGVGATAGNGNGGGFGAPSGLGMQQSASASQAPAGRMSLGLGSNDGRMDIGANDGRMDAGIYDDQPDARRYSSAMWGQAFGAGLTQNERANVDGYDTHIYGAMAGVDNWVTPNTRLGLAGGYGNTSIDGSGDTEKNKTDIDSYLGILYGAYKGSGWYASGRLGYAWHDYTTARYLTVPVAGYGDGRPLRRPVLGLRRGRHTAALHGRRADSDRLAHLEPARSERLHGSERRRHGSHHRQPGEHLAVVRPRRQGAGPDRHRHAPGRSRHLVPRVRGYQSAGDGRVRRRAGLQRCRTRRRARHGSGWRRVVCLRADRRQLPAQLRRAAAAGLYRPHRIGAPEGRVLGRSGGLGRHRGVKARW